jgi:glutamate-5-semialdehyde dehydrogenase
VGVIGANFEARPNVVVDVASQLIKSRNAGVLRTGSSAIRSAAVLVDEVLGPAMAAAGLDPAAIQLLRVPGHDSALALVRQTGLIPLVILRGSGQSTRELAREAALQGVRTLAHADGGAVVYIDSSADTELALQLIERSLDRLGVCNRLNLLLVQAAFWDTMLPQVIAVADRIGIKVSLPPHQHSLGHEWALDAGSEATITVAPADDAADAAEIANRETSGLAGSIVASDQAAAERFLDAYSGTGAFWNSTPRLLDGFKLLSVPETGINIDVVPGPRGPVTFRDLYLRQYAVVPKQPS